MLPGQSANFLSLQPIGTPFPFPNSPAPTVNVLVRRLPPNTTNESLQLMTFWANDLLRAEVLPAEQSIDEGYSTAILKFRTMAGAQEVKDTLDGRRLNPGNETHMLVEIIEASPSGSQQPSNGSGTTSPLTSASTSSPALGGSRQTSRMNGGFPPIETRTAHPNGIASHELPTPDKHNEFHSIFQQQQSQHLNRTRATGKALIENNSADDDETRDLLNNPVAFAEINTPTGRRATEPRIPVSRLQTMNINMNVNGNNRNNQPTSASVPSPFPNALSPSHGHPVNGMNGANAGMGYPMNHHFQRHNFPPVNPADQNPPCNTLYVGNLPADTNEDELKSLFLKQRGYKRLCFRTKQNGPMCFVEFEDISFATKALNELYGLPLHNSTKGGIRLSFSKNPLGVRSGHNNSASNSGSAAAMNGHIANGLNGFATAHGPPPGLSAPPGLGQSRTNFNGGNANNSPNFNTTGFSGNSNYPWNQAATYPGHPQIANGGQRSSNPNQLPLHMIGR